MKGRHKQISDRAWRFLPMAGSLSAPFLQLKPIFIESPKRILFPLFCFLPFTQAAQGHMSLIA
jgi:hypothetical protein